MIKVASSLGGHQPTETDSGAGLEGLDVADRDRVELLGTDVEQGFINFARTG